MVARPVAATPGPSADVSTNASGSLLTFTTDSGTFTLDVQRSMLRTAEGHDIRLAPDAVTFFRDAYYDIQSADSTARALANARPPAATPCSPRVQSCGPSRPLRVPDGTSSATTFATPPRMPDFGFSPLGANAAATTLPYVDATRSMEDGVFSCRDISTAMMDLMPEFRRAKKQYENALGMLKISTAASVGTGVYDPATGRISFPNEPPKTIVQILSHYQSRYIGLFFAEVSVSYFKYMKTRLGVLGTMYNANQCATRTWDPPPPQVPRGAGGGGATPPPPSGGGGRIMCMYRDYIVDGIVVTTTVLYCFRV